MLSVAIAVGLLVAVWVGLRPDHSRPDAVLHPRPRGRGRHRERRRRPVSQFPRPGAARDRLCRGLHRRRLDADRSRLAHRFLALGASQGGSVRDFLRRRRHPFLADHPGARARLPGVDHRLAARRLPRQLMLTVVPARPPRAGGAVPPPRRLADRQPPWRLGPASRCHPGHHLIAVPILIARRLRRGLPLAAAPVGGSPIAGLGDPWTHS